MSIRDRSLDTLSPWVTDYLRERKRRPELGLLGVTLSPYSGTSTFSKEPNRKCGEGRAQKAGALTSPVHRLPVAEL